MRASPGESDAEGAEAHSRSATATATVIPPDGTTELIQSSVDDADSSRLSRAPGLRGLEHQSIRWNLRTAMYDGAAYALMVGLGQEILSPFVLAAHDGAAVAAGLVISVPLLLGALVQMASPMLVRRMGCLRTAVIVYTLIQAASLAGLAACALFRFAPLWLIFLLAGVYWGSGLAGGAAWSTWMPGNVPRKLRARYFGVRTRVIHGCTVAGLVISGSSLELAKRAGDDRFTTFAILFIVAGIARCISALYQTLQSKGTQSIAAHRTVPFGEIARKLRSHPGLRLLRYMLVVQFTCCIGLHYLNPFALDQRQFNYVQYQLLIAAPYITRMLILPVMGTYAHHHGARRVLRLAGIGLIPLSGVWMISGSFAYLFAVQLIAGVVWAAYELSTFLLILETIPEDERTSVMTTYYLGNAIAMVSGSLIGGTILRAFDKSHEGYMLIFALSMAARLVSLFFLIRLTRTPMTKAR